MTTHCNASGFGSERISLRISRPQGFWTGMVLKLQDYAEYRKQRRALLTLDDHMLKDIGINRAEAARIVSKDFDWFGR
jgi:uncharacterized protein YjiS (DUF1127 family)